MEFKKPLKFGKISLLKATSEEKHREDDGEKKDLVEDGNGFGKFSKFSLESKVNEFESEEDEVENEEDEIENEGTLENDDVPAEGNSNGMEELMGFSVFGKKAKQFDVEEMFMEAKQTANERNLVKQVNSMSMDVNGVMIEVRDPHWQNNDEQDAENSDDEEGSDSELIGPPLPPSMLNDHEEEKEDELFVPLKNYMVLEHGCKPVSAITIDPAGARCVTGSLDYDLKFWDFAGMNASLHSFRTLRPCECHPIKHLQYSTTGDTVLVISGSAQAKVLDRDGFEILECPKGYQYIADMAQTKGHIANLNDGTWHPRDREEFLTCANDGTLRIWTLKGPIEKKQLHVIKPRGANGLKSNPTACTYSRDGKVVTCVCEDGSIQMWDHQKSYVNTMRVLRGAHQSGTRASCIVYSYDGNYLSTRGGDDTLKLWDVRMLKSAVHSATDLFNRFDMTNCVFSPNDSLVVTGTSLRKGESDGKLLIYNRNTFELISSVTVFNSDVVGLLWHPRLNQIIVGGGNGNVKMYYDLDKSHNGALLCAAKSMKKTKHVEMITSQQIISPHSLPLFRQQRPKSTRKQMEKDRQDPLKSRRPELPLQGVGTGGRVAASGSTLSSYIIRNLGLSKKVADEQDPREALLKYAKIAEEDPYWVSPAYHKTQPKPIFLEPADEEEDQGGSAPKKKKV